MFWNDPRICIFLGIDRIGERNRDGCGGGNARVGKDNPCPAGIFDCKLRLSILARYTAYIQCRSDMISRREGAMTYQWRGKDGLREES